MIQHNARRLLSRLHLYIGLSFGIVFVLLGLTGSALAWIHELDTFLNPGLLRVQPGPGLNAGDPASVPPAAVDALMARLAADPRYGRPGQLTLPEHADEPVIATYRRKSAPAPTPFALEVSRQVMVDPYTRQVVGERNWGEVGLSRPLLMPTLFHVHRYLLAGEWGKTVTGVTGLVMAIAALTGIALWLPKATLKALRQSLRISYRGSMPRFNYSFHRAAGFFAAPLLVVIGITGLYFNLPKWVTPVVSSVAQVSTADKVTNRAKPAGPAIDPGQAVAIAQQRFPTARISRLALPSKPSAPFELRVRQPGEVRQGDGATRIFIDAYSGEVLRVRDPLLASGGDTFLNWFFPIHTGEAFGTAGRVFISVFGIVPLLFFATGFALWWRRRRSHAAMNQPSRIPTPMSSKSQKGSFPA